MLGGEDSNPQRLDQNQLCYRLHHPRMGGPQPYPTTSADRTPTEPAQPDPEVGGTKAATTGTHAPNPRPRPGWGHKGRHGRQIGRASCRDRVCPHVYNPVVAVSVNQQSKPNHTTQAP